MMFDTSVWHIDTRVSHRFEWGQIREIINESKERVPIRRLSIYIPYSSSHKQHFDDVVQKVDPGILDIQADLPRDVTPNIRDHYFSVLICEFTHFSRLREVNITGYILKREIELILRMCSGIPTLVFNASGSYTPSSLESFLEWGEENNYFLITHKYLDVFSDRYILRSKKDISLYEMMICRCFP